MASIIKADTLQSTTSNVFVLNSAGTEYARFDSTGVFQLANPTTFPAGTAALPSITATGDTNTGLYFPAADTIAFAEGGAEAMRIDASGNIGIGTVSPGSKLHVAGSFRQTGATAPFEWTVNAGGADFYKLNAVGYADNLIVANSLGNVGIGTSSPTAKLHVSKAGVEVARFTNTQSNGADYEFKLGGGGFEDRKFMLTDKFSGADNVRTFVDSSGNFAFNSGYGSAAVAYGCRAWVSFNGTGTVAILASGNVSSITDNGTGIYTVNFTTAMPDANYAGFLGNGGGYNDTSGTKTASAFQVYTYNFANPPTASDRTPVSVAVFR